MTVADPPGGGLWAALDRIQADGFGVALTTAQIRELLADNARLAEAKNDIVRRFGLLGVEWNRRREELTGEKTDLVPGDGCFDCPGG